MVFILPKSPIGKLDIKKEHFPKDYRLALLIIVYVATSLLVSSHGGRVRVLGDGSSIFSVLDYGAVGDGKQDDTQAFSKAWTNVCNAIGNTPTLVVPQGKTFLLNSIKFKGPCKSPDIHFQIEGDIVAHNDISEWENCEDNTWIYFAYIDNLFVQGQGSIDGRGSIWWKNAPLLTNRDTHATINEETNSCNRPTALRFLRCYGLQVRGTTHKNSPGNHITLAGTNNSTISNINIFAPKDSPNTDGIDISSTNHLNILNSVIETGDDCIAIGSNTTWINIANVTCGPGHGISVGSLGEDGAQAKVEEIHVSNCTFNNTSNGARIKTWQGGSGYARKITYDNIILIDAKNPIIIDQYYCNGDKNCKTQASAVAITDVKFSEFRGTSASEAAITLNCSQVSPCNTIVMETIDITTSDRTKILTSKCENAHPLQNSVVPLVHCAK
ncbi:probable polygalacturonase At3g15720 [Spinacia oleracea]|uniref:Probable polygalacturonase At3g15720 n=1 Tax=Spinacia oleracea TaxID=3562 RepID=A0ABM3RGN5_SPIOL|nr:probable polygalacturonase At3g15720 [Spinacia oleracea]